MDKLIRIKYSQENNPHGMLVELEKTLDGVEWHLVFATRVHEGKQHYWGDEVPNEYVHIEILNKIKQLVSKGYRFVE
jgi:hypothetical protein